MNTKYGVCKLLLKLGKIIFSAAGFLLAAAFLVMLVVGTPDERYDNGDAPAVTPLQNVSREEPVAMNILIVGRDRASGLSDVLMLVRLDEAEGAATVLQIPRDTYAAYTDASYRKLNGAPQALGLSGLCSFLSGALGVPIDRYVALDLETFGDIVDAVGGVELTLPSPLHYDDPAQGLAIHLAAGRQLLDGKAAEQMVRYRAGYLRGDLGRIDAQKLFLAAFLGRMRTLSLSEALRLATTLLPRVNTNLSVPELLRFYRLLPSVRDERIALVTLPGQDCVGKKSGASYYVISAPAADEVMSRYFGATAGSFDVERRFRHATNEDFAALYDTYSPYRVYAADDIVENGIEIAKTP